jgi:hypothetical protein
VALVQPSCPLAFQPDDALNYEVSADGVLGRDLLNVLAGLDSHIAVAVAKLEAKSVLYNDEMRMVAPTALKSALDLFSVSLSILVLALLAPFEIAADVVPVASVSVLNEHLICIVIGKSLVIAKSQDPKALRATLDFCTMSFFVRWISGRVEPHHFPPVLPQ